MGEFLCMIVYIIKTQYIKHNTKEDPDAPPKPMGDVITTADGRILKTKINPLLLAIPACFDVIASTLMNIALTLINASIYQMLRGMLVIVTAFMSIIFLKAKLYRHHWTSLTVLFIGVFMVGLSSFLTPTDNKHDKTPEMQAIGLALIVIAQLFAGSLLIVEEKLLGNY